MNFIPCSADCRFQNEGACTLGSVSNVQCAKPNGCAYYVGKQESPAPTKQLDRPRM